MSRPKIAVGGMFEHGDHVQTVARSPVDHLTKMPWYKFNFYWDSYAYVLEVEICGKVCDF